MNNLADCSYRFREPQAEDPDGTALVMQVRGLIQPLAAVGGAAMQLGGINDGWGITGCLDASRLAATIHAMMITLGLQSHEASEDQCSRINGLGDTSWLVLLRPEEERLIPPDAIGGFVAMSHEEPNDGVITIAFCLISAKALLSEFIDRLGWFKATIVPEGLALAKMKH